MDGPLWQRHRDANRRVWDGWRFARNRLWLKMTYRRDIVDVGLTIKETPDGRGRGVFASARNRVTIRSWIPLLKFDLIGTGYESYSDAKEAAGRGGYVLEVARRKGAAAERRWRVYRAGTSSGHMVNHSPDGNCKLIESGQALWVKSMRAIAPGEEILVDYTRGGSQDGLQQMFETMERERKQEVASTVGPMEAGKRRKAEQRAMRMQRVRSFIGTGGSDAGRHIESISRMPTRSVGAKIE